MMNAMIIDRICDLSKDNAPLSSVQLPVPVPGDNDVLIKVSACGVCHTELDEIEGRTAPSGLPMIPGHQVVGRVVGNGSGADRFSHGDRVGVAWIYSACGTCDFCRSGLENLCLAFNAIRKEGGDRKRLMDLDYARHLWQEKEIKSVANVSRADVQAFLTLADQMAMTPQVQTYGLQEANQALLELKQRRIRGAKVLVM